MKWYAIAGATDELLEAVAEEYGMATTSASSETAGRKPVNRVSQSTAFSDAEIAQVKGLLSGHAGWRLRRRGLSAEDVAYILRHGACEQVAAATIYYLRAADVAGDEGARFERLVGTAVITAPDCDRIITVWRNRAHGLRNLRQKRHRRWRNPLVEGNQAA